ncbi:uncharacterized protein F4822DRAFT_388452 [Hypoxylon trugodes]|uniref:uncharacterized protein n=1 Tax=Hypoxylon trugodes TaxID=326681 RepID=UPI00219BFFF8|nr:uncharacterized protein F4822DRAFT_388452 [Hypoxylon trugodes]KAI1391795.1 hypothetical protein F4822DRAFT_388452 [Hypoxylon trugodes]
MKINQTKSVSFLRQLQPFYPSTQQIHNTTVELECKDIGTFILSSYHGAYYSWGYGSFIRGKLKRAMKRKRMKKKVKKTTGSTRINYYSWKIFVVVSSLLLPYSES